MAQNKIIRLGLDKVVEDLITNGHTTSTAISQKLKELGHSVSQPTVSRYLAELKDTRREETKKIVEDHVQKNVPADLDALQMMEAQCLAWAGENNAAFAHRLAKKHIQDAAPDWINMILGLGSLDAKKSNEALENIMDQCLRWVADDLRLQNARIAAMKQASAIIQMKLHFALGESTDGKIIFLDSDRGDRLLQDEQPGRFVVIPGGQANG